MTHEQKVRPALYGRIADGSMTFWMALNETGFQLGDTVLLCEFDEDPVNATSSSPKGPTGRELTFRVGYVHVLDRDHVVFSLLPAPAAAAKKAR